MQNFFKRTVRVASALMIMGALLAPATCVAAETRIQPGDKLQLTVFNHPELSAELTVTSSGDVRVPLAGDVTVDGLSQQTATARVQQALTPYLLHPAVDLTVIAQGQSIFFTGSLIGVAPYQPGETLAAAVGAFRQLATTGQAAASPGQTSFSNIDLRAIRVARGGVNSAPLDLERLERLGESGPRLAPGDIVVLRVKPVRVDVRGNLSTPAVVYLYPGETLAQAVAQTGTILPSTSLTSIVLQRDGINSMVSSAGGEFRSAARDGDIVTLEPAPRVSVLGMVEKAGDTTMQGRPTLLAALYGAGGPNRYADLAHISVSHQGVTRIYDVAKLTHGDLSEDAEIHDGDVIFVPEGHKIDLGAFTTALGALTSLKFLSGL